MRDQNLTKNWQIFFDISPSKIIVVDRKGQRTADGNAEKYNNQYDFSDSMNMSIRKLFRINWAWTEEEFKITITKAEIVPVAYNNDGFYGRTTEQIKNIRKHDFNYAKRGANVLCRLNYKSVNDRTQQEQIISTGIFLPYQGSLESLAKHAGYSLSYSSDNKDFKNILQQVFEKQFSK
jgi:hypothetical protein